MVKGLEMIYFGVISNVGGACSSYIEAVQKAEQDDSKGARECTRAGQETLLAGHEAHFKLTQKEAQGEQVGDSMIPVHAGDQFMSVEGFKVIVEEVPASYERITELEKGLENR